MALFTNVCEFEICAEGQLNLPIVYGLGLKRYIDKWSFELAPLTHRCDCKEGSVFYHARLIDDHTYNKTLYYAVHLVNFITICMPGTLIRLRKAIHMSPPKKGSVLSMLMYSKNAIPVKSLLNSLSPDEKEVWRFKKGKPHPGNFRHDARNKHYKLSMSVGMNLCCCINSALKVTSLAADFSEDCKVEIYG